MKTEVRNEFILEVHKSACSEWKLKIEKECSELFKSKLEVGKWYKHDLCLYYVTSIYNETKEYTAFGFDFVGVYQNNSVFGKTTDYYLINCIPATEEEVKEAIIKEAKKIGFKSGVKIKSLLYGKSILNDYSYTFLFKDNELWFGGCLIFKKGKWAEICEEPKKITIQEIENILGYNIEIVK